jgi:hypothetical protein
VASGTSRQLFDNQPQNLEHDDHESKIVPLPYSSTQDEQVTYRHLLNTKRDHLILITQVNDTLISELISSGVITDESDFTENDVRLKLSHIL